MKAGSRKQRLQKSFRLEDAAKAPDTNGTGTVRISRRGDSRAVVGRFELLEERLMPGLQRLTFRC